MAWNVQLKILTFFLIDFQKPCQVHIQGGTDECNKYLGDICHKIAVIYVQVMCISLLAVGEISRAVLFLDKQSPHHELGPMKGFYYHLEEGSTKRVGAPKAVTRILIRQRTESRKLSS